MQFVLYLYHILHLINKSVNITISVHRLVAIKFIDNPNEKKIVNHINGIKTDNRIENLEWVTQSENTFLYYNDNRISNISHLL